MLPSQSRSLSRWSDRILIRSPLLAHEISIGRSTKMDPAGWRNIPTRLLVLPWTPVGYCLEFGAVNNILLLRVDGRLTDGLLAEYI